MSFTCRPNPCKAATWFSKFSSPDAMTKKMTCSRWWGQGVHSLNPWVTIWSRALDNSHQTYKNVVIWSYWDLEVNLLLQCSLTWLTDFPNQILRGFMACPQNIVKTQPSAPVWSGNRHIRGLFIAFMEMLSISVLQSSLQNYVIL